MGMVCLGFTMPGSQLQDSLGGLKSSEGSTSEALTLTPGKSLPLQVGLHRATWVSSQHGGWLPPEQVIQEGVSQVDGTLFTT